MKIKLEIFLIAILFTYCSTDIVKKETSTFEDSTSAKYQKSSHIINKQKPLQKKVLLGIDVLEQNGFKTLRNKRVGLITNQTGVNSNLKSTIDVLNDSPDVNLVALFGPEHGVRGDTEGGKYVDFYFDETTNLPVFSLYGKTRKPSKKMLADLDILVYDIQDIGVRSYTFISTMGLAIEAASEAGIDFLILDRPNPLGGEKIEGNIVENGFQSFISQYPIPYVYGLTSGELAKLLVKEKIINTNNNFHLKIAGMKNWKRKMTWDDTGLQWVPTSPHIPHSHTSFFYPMTGILGELRDAISIGVGYTLPFQIIGAKWINGIELAKELNKMNINGLFFRPISFKPYYAFGKGEVLQGVQIHIIDYDKVNLTKTQFYIISALQRLYPSKNLFQLATKNQIAMFNKGIGTDKIEEMIVDKLNFNNIFQFLDNDVKKFRELSKKYYLYN